jgi:hypothetical protein
VQLKERTMKTETTKIEIKLVDSNVTMRWLCHVCGSFEKYGDVLAEGRDEHGIVRVCPECLEAGDIDDRLRHSVEILRASLDPKLRDQAPLIEKLIGRLMVPSYVEYWEAFDSYERRCAGAFDA